MSVLAGRSEFMDLIARGEVIHAGTLNGNPLCLAAARATIEVLAADNGSGNVYRGLRARADRLRDGIAAVLKETGLPVVLSGDGPVFQVSFMEEPARNYRETLRAQTGLYACLLYTSRCV